MAKADFKSVEEYLATQPRDVQAALRRVRDAIRKAVPRAVEQISYGMPTYKLDGAPVIYFGAWKQHYALYGASAAIVAALRDDLERYEIAKGTIRFPLSEPVPERLIGRIARLRAVEAAERARAKKAAPKRRR